jgi:hypothetical protein
MCNVSCRLSVFDCLKFMPEHKGLQVCQKVSQRNSFFSKTLLILRSQKKMLCLIAFHKRFSTWKNLGNGLVKTKKKY